MSKNIVSHLFIVFLSAVVMCFQSVYQSAHAQLSFRVGSGGQFQPLPIAITDFSGDGEMGTKVAGIITANLKRSGYFTPLDKARFPEKGMAFDVVPNFAAWQGTGVQALVTGRVSRDASGRLKVEFRLWDVLSSQQSIGQQYTTDAANIRRISHVISDGIYTKITGIGGFFDTRIVFVDESGPKETRRKRLAVMDQDGAGVRYLTKGDEIVITPRYSPVSQDIAYMTQRIGDQPRINVLGIDSGQVQSVGNFPDMTSSPRFSPDGGRILLSLQQGGNANLYTVDLRSRVTTRITSTAAIDTSPAYSPDGQQIVFESDRGGSQQLYVMPAGGGEARRLSFGEGSYAQPAWSPRGDFIAFTKRKAGGFAIGIMKPDGSGERLLTEGFHNESPSWAPNGQYIIFYRDPGGQSGGRLYMVDITGRVESPIPTPGFAADPAWSSLLSGAR